MKILFQTNKEDCSEELRQKIIIEQIKIQNAWDTHEKGKKLKTFYGENLDSNQIQKNGSKFITS